MLVPVFYMLIYYYSLINYCYLIHNNFNNSSREKILNTNLLEKIWFLYSQIIRNLDCSFSSDFFLLLFFFLKKRSYSIKKSWILNLKIFLKLNFKDSRYNNIYYFVVNKKIEFLHIIFPPRLIVKLIWINDNRN